MRNAGGYAIITEPGMQSQEYDTFTCWHCNNVVHVKPGGRPEDLGGFCRACMKHICSKCADLPCDIFEKKLERMEAKEAALRSYGMA